MHVVGGCHKTATFAPGDRSRASRSVRGSARRPGHRTMPRPPDQSPRRALDLRHARRVKRQINDPRPKPDPPAERRPLAGRPAIRHRSARRSRSGSLLEIGLRAHQPAGHRVGRRKRFVARADVPLAAILRVLNRVAAKMWTNSSSAPSARILSSTGIVIPLHFRYGTSTVSFAFAQHIRIIERVVQPAAFVPRLARSG